MDLISALPHFNALLNATSAVLMLVGFFHIRRKNPAWHRRFMIAAIVSSTLFLISYLFYHAHVGSVRFQRQDGWRPVYFAVLISHSALAGLVLPLVIISATRALRGRYAQHRRIARWTLPVWVYVSLTGVIVYLMLYYI
jgi:putative membrane protein